MPLRTLIKRIIPRRVADVLRARGLTASHVRRESNRWLRQHCFAIEGDVLSIGSMDDSDGEGGRYRDYFANSSTYTTSEVTAEHGCDLVVDIRTATGIASASYDCVVCSGVLEHVDDWRAALGEIARILKDGGVLLLGVPFRQAVHMAPQDFWRFTRYGVEHMLKDRFRIDEVAEVDAKRGEVFPAAYWVMATKEKNG